MKTVSITAFALTLLATSAFAKLPPLSDEAKAKAAEAGAKTAWAGKVDAFKLCKAQDRVVAHVNKGGKAAKGEKGEKPAASTCADPGPFVAAGPAGAAPAAATAAAPAAPAKAAAKKS